MKQLAEVLEDLREVETARSLYEELLPLQIAETGNLSNEVCMIENCLVTIALLKGEYTEAYTRLQVLLEKHRNMYGQVHTLIAHNMRDMGYILDRWGRWTEALAMFRDALLIQVELRDYSVDRSAHGKEKAKTTANTNTKEDGGCPGSHAHAHHRDILDVLGVKVTFVPPAEDSLHIADLFVCIANVLCEIDTRAGGPVDGTQGGNDWLPHGASDGSVFTGGGSVSDNRSTSVESLLSCSQHLDSEYSTIDGGMFVCVHV